MASVQRLARFQVLRAARPAGRRLARPPRPHHPVARHASDRVQRCAFDETADVLVVGAGAAGLLAALRCHHHGLRPLIVEKADRIGGAAAYSGGCVWVPNNHLQAESGFKDSPELARQYLDSLIGDVGPASTPGRRRAFLENAPRMAAFLRDIGFKWQLGHTYPDYHPGVPGGLGAGRTLEGDVFDLKLLGEGRRLINKNPSAPPTPPVHSFQAGRMARPMASLGDFAFGLKMMLRWARHLLLGRDPVTFGLSLVGQMMLLNQQRRTDIWLQAPLQELLTDSSGAVTGAVVSRDGKDVRVQAKRGVVLAAGGFAKNQAMRETYHAHPVDSAWSSAPPHDTGDAVQAGIRLNAATALMDDAWWGPTMMIPGLGPYFAMWDRHLPHSVCIDGSGQRFMNEAQPYVDAGRDQYKRNAIATAIPTWYIVDSNYQRRYLLALNPPFCSPDAGVKSGLFIEADTVEDLARQTGIDEAKLQQTLKRFNGFARTGVDEDFGRGDSAFDRCMGDPKHRPNPCLGSIERPPFYAIKLYPGDLGTKGGLLTDEHGRVIDKQGRPVRGLYASGNTTASVMGHRYPGAGATLGPALTFSYIGIDHIASARKA